MKNLLTQPELRALHSTPHGANRTRSVNILRSSRANRNKPGVGEGLFVQEFR
jgi:hypothetical protein